MLREEGTFPPARSPEIGPVLIWIVSRASYFITRVLFFSSVSEELHRDQHRLRKEQAEIVPSVHIGSPSGFVKTSSALPIF